MHIAIAMIVGAAALGVTGLLGYWLGMLLRARTRVLYWMVNAAWLAAGGAACAVGARYGAGWAWALGVGTMAGGLTGLKYGLGDVTGAFRLRSEGEAGDARARDESGMN